MLGLGFPCVEWHGCTHFYYFTHIFNPFVVAQIGSGKAFYEIEKLFQ